MFQKPVLAADLRAFRISTGFSGNMPVKIQWFLEKISFRDKIRAFFVQNQPGIRGQERKLLDFQILFCYIWFKLSRYEILTDFKCCSFYTSELLQ